MNLYKIAQTINNDYDTYSDAVVVAATPEDAVRVHPHTIDGYFISWDSEWLPDGAGEGRLPGAWAEVCLQTGKRYERDCSSWAEPSQVTALLIGVAADGLRAGDVICASFHAG
jgi:hypothetical protein